MSEKFAELVSILQDHVASLTAAAKKARAADPHHNDQIYHAGRTDAFEEVGRLLRTTHTLFADARKTTNV